MTTVRASAIFATVAAGLAGLLAAIDGPRGLWGTVVAAAICAAPLAVSLLSPRVADTASDPRISAYRWTMTHVRRIVVRLGWCLTAGSAAYLLARPHFGVSYWVALLVLYQIALVLAVTAHPLGPTTAGPIEGLSPNAPGRRLSTRRR